MRLLTRCAFAAAMLCQLLVSAATGLANARAESKEPRNFRKREGRSRRGHSHHERTGSQDLLALPQDRREAAPVADFLAAHDARGLGTNHQAHDQPQRTEDGTGRSARNPEVSRRQSRPRAGRSPPRGVRSREAHDRLQVSPTRIPNPPARSATPWAASFRSAAPRANGNC